MTNREALLRKLKALSERGEGGEAINAADKLQKLLKQYGMDESDLEDEQQERCIFKAGKGQFDEKLLHQVIYMVMGNVPLYGTVNRFGRKVPKSVGVYCTKAEQIEIQAAYDFYQYHLNAGLAKYCEAFIQKEYIFPDESKKQIKQSEPPTEIDEDMIRLYHSIDKHDRNPQLEAGKGR